MGQLSNYYPQGNGLVEYKNKTFIQVLKNVFFDSQWNWHKQLNNALWESRITPKDNTGQSPYLLIYGNKYIIPINLEIHALTVVYEREEEGDSSRLQS